MQVITFIIYSSIYIGLISITFFILTFIDDKKKPRIFFKDKELPNISVIIPAFNEEETIASTLDSILASDYPKKFEVIVIDDGSKDKTLSIANKYKKKGVRVFKQAKNQGKGAALNLGIKKAKYEIIFTMDADTEVPKSNLKKMAKYFKDPEVMSITPSIVTHPPKNLLERIQHIEYVTGIFLRKTFAALNAVHIAPGAFSGYRKSFFEKYGGYDEDNLTEDLEMALRIQYYNYKVENADDAPAYTRPPSKHSPLLKQRKRWYIGLMKNTWNYKKLFSREYGDLGIFILPIAWISILFAISVTTYFLYDISSSIYKEILFYKSINFDFGSFLDINFYFFERLFFKLASNNIIIFLLIFFIVTGIYLNYASKRIGKISNLLINFPLFFILFPILFGFWWIVSVFYVIFNKNVSWS